MKKYLFTLIILFAGCHESNENVEIGQQYRFLKNGKHSYIVRVNAKDAGIRNQVYSWVKNISYNNEFVIMEQKTEKELYIADLGQNLKLQYLVMTDSGGIVNPKRVNDLVFWAGYTDSINYRLFDSAFHKAKEDGKSFKDVEVKTQTDIAKNLVASDTWQRKILSSDTNYWILQLSLDSLWGPYSLIEYRQARERLHVSPKLKLSSE